MHAHVPIHLRLLAGLLVACGTSTEVAAQSVFKCIDEAGHIAYQDRPCAAGARSAPIHLDAAPPRENRDVAPPPPTPARASRASMRPPRAAPVAHSFECRSASGAVFYRHGRCPASIPRARSGSQRGYSGNDRVESTRLPRSEACRRLRSTAREGSAHDETVSTYERNLGRDPCRRH